MHAINYDWSIKQTVFLCLACRIQKLVGIETLPLNLNPTIKLISYFQPFSKLGYLPFFAQTFGLHFHALTISPNVKNLVCIFQCGSGTRLVQGMYIVHEPLEG